MRVSTRGCLYRGIVRCDVVAGTQCSLYLKCSSLGMARLAWPHYFIRVHFVEIEDHRIVVPINTVTISSYRNSARLMSRACGHLFA